MPQNLTVNGVVYAYPTQNDQQWGVVASAWAAAVSTSMLQLSGGNFTLTADVNFGATYGLISAYFKSYTSNTAAAGAFRLSNTDTINFRNAANNADLALGVDASNNLLFNTHIIANSSGVIPVTSGGTGVTSVTTAPAATAWAGWDANKNLSANNILNGYTTTPTAAGTTTLLVGSAGQQVFTGSTTQTVLLPVTSTLVAGMQFLVVNLSTGVVTVQSSGANTLQAMASNSQLLVTVISTSGTGTASWNWLYTPGLQTTAAGIYNALSPMSTTGDIEYESGANTAARLAGNTSATRNFLSQTGNGSVSAAPIWATIANSDLVAISQLALATGVAVHGSNTNDSAAAGYVGEYIAGVVSSPTSTPATTVFGDATSISLTAGDWDISFIVSFILNGATTTSVTGGISTTTGNSSTGLVYGDNRADVSPPTASIDSTVVIPGYRKSLSSTTTIYGKVAATFSAGQPQFQCRLSARRVR